MKPYTGKRLPLWREICYGGGNFTASMFGTIIGTWLTFFYVDTLGYDTKAIGGAMVIYSIWNAINDPIMGLISDKTHTKLGRRLPYVLFGAIPLALAFFFIFSPPSHILTSRTSQIIYFTLSLCVYDFFFTTVLLNWEAVVPDMYPDEKDRSRIIGIAQVLDILGGIVASLAVQPVFTAYGWKAMAAIFGVIGGITMLLSVLGMKENINRIQASPLAFAESFRQTFKSKAFITCVFSVLCVETARLMLLAAAPFYAKYTFPDIEMAATVMTSVIFVSGLLFTPIAIYISSKRGVKYAYQLSLIAFAVVSCGFFFSKNFTVCIVLSVLMGMGVTGGLIMPKLLNTEIIDEDQVRTGRRREGAFYGIYAFVIRFASAIESIILTQIMSAFGYSSSLQQQPESAVLGIRVLMSFIPALLIMAGYLIAAKYPLYGERLSQMKKDLSSINQQK